MYFSCIAKEHHVAFSFFLDTHRVDVRESSRLLSSYFIFVLLNCIIKIGEEKILDSLLPLLKSNNMSPLNGKTFVLELSREIRFKAKQELINYLREQNAQISYILTASVGRIHLGFFAN